MKLKFRLDSAVHNEWIRMELTGDTLKLFHTCKMNFKSSENKKLILY